MAVTNQAGQIKSLQRGSIVMGAVASATATISAVNTAKSEVRLLGYTFGIGQTDAATYLGALTLTNSTTLTASRGTATNSLTVHYEVTEWY